MKKISIVVLFVLMLALCFASCNRAAQPEGVGNAAENGENISENSGIEQDKDVTNSTEADDVLEYSINIYEGDLESNVIDAPIGQDVLELANKPYPENGPVQIGIGGDAMATFKYLGYDDFEGIPSSFSLHKAVDEDEYDEWINNLNSRNGKPVTSLYDYCNLYSFYKRFNIPEDVFKTLLLKGGRTEEDADMVLNGTENEIINYFNYANHIVIDDRFYSTYWIINASVEEIKAAGITSEMILSKLDNYLGLFRDDKESREILEAKLSVIAGKKISLQSFIEKFIEKFGITVNGTRYAVWWICEEESEVLANAGITVEMLEEFIDLLEPFTDVSLYKNEKNAKTVKSYYEGVKDARVRLYYYIYGEFPLIPELEMPVS